MYIWRRCCSSTLPLLRFAVLPMYKCRRSSIWAIMWIYMHAAGLWCSCRKAASIIYNLRLSGFFVVYKPGQQSGRQWETILTLSKTIRCPATPAMNMRIVKSPRLYLRHLSKIEPRHLLVTVIILAILSADTVVCGSTRTSSRKWTKSFRDSYNDAIIRTTSLTNSWAVQLRGPSVTLTAAAHTLATKYGMVNLGQVSYT